jgi:hypothetical protein
MKTNSIQLGAFRRTIVARAAHIKKELSVSGPDEYWQGRLGMAETLLEDFDELTKGEFVPAEIAADPSDLVG